MMFNKKKKNILENNFQPEIPKRIHPVDRQNNYIKLVKNSLRKTDTIDVKMSDEEGLSRAYKTDKGICIFGDRMYIAGTRTLNDWKEDVMYIPDWGDSKNRLRYQDAKDALIAHPEVKHITGHSMGGVASLQLQKDDYGIDGTRVYGTPVLDLHTGGNPDRYRNYGDPFSAFDLNAQTSYENTTLNPKTNHSYISLGKYFYITKSVPVETIQLNNSKSLIA